MSKLNKTKLRRKAKIQGGIMLSFGSNRRYKKGKLRISKTFMRDGHKRNWRKIWNALADEYRHEEKKLNS